MEQRKLTELFNKHYRRLVWFANSVVKDMDDAKDIVSTLFLRVAKMDYWSAKNDEAALMFMCKQEIARFFENKKRRDNLNKNQAFYDLDMLADAKIIHSEIISWLCKKRDDLPESRRKIFDLFFLQHEGMDEIASMLGININTVRTQIKRIRDEFKIFREKRYAFYEYKKATGNTTIAYLKRSLRDPNYYTYPENKDQNKKP